MLSGESPVTNFPRIILLVGVSGAGKSTAQKILLEEHPNWFNIVAHTTRGRRLGEVPGVDYNFVTPEVFEAMKYRLVEHAHVHGNEYGLHASQFERIISDNLTGIKSIDYQGARTLQRLYGTKIVKVIHLTLSRGNQKQRLIDRGTDSMEVIDARIAKSDEERIECDRIADIVIGNDGTIKQMMDLIRSHL